MFSSDIFPGLQMDHVLLGTLVHHSFHFSAQSTQHEKSMDKQVRGPLRAIVIDYNVASELR
jgi:hypothetical protein